MSKSSTITSKGGLLLNPHPGEILLEEFLSARTHWRVRFTSHHAASTKLCWASATLRPTPTFGSRAISDYLKAFFSVCRWIMI